MKKSTKIAFVVFNVLYFLFDWILVAYLPNPVLFGWLPLQLGILLFFPIVGAIVWGLYFNVFFNTQSHVEYKN